MLPVPAGMMSCCGRRLPRPQDGRCYLLASLRGRLAAAGVCGCGGALLLAPCRALAELPVGGCSRIRRRKPSLVSNNQWQLRRLRAPFPSMQALSCDSRTFSMVAGAVHSVAAATVQRKLCARRAGGVSPSHGLPGFLTNHESLGFICFSVVLHFLDQIDTGCWLLLWFGECLPLGAYASSALFLLVVHQSYARW